jgi:signal transduction histidine kinase
VNRMAAAGELSAAIAHEVRQPLTGMISFANAGLRWLSGDAPNVGKARDALREIVGVGQVAAEIVTSVRAMFTKDNGERSPVDINKLIWTVLELLQFDLRRDSIELRTRLSEDLPAVMANEVQLRQVILNLLMNAVEAMRSGDRRVLSVSAELVQPGRLRVSIEDSGSGIDPANLDRIFKPLFTTKTSGMGMGLSICQSIIEAHDGRISAAHAVNGGSIFSFELPAQVDGDTFRTV